MEPCAENERGCGNYFFSKVGHLNPTVWSQEAEIYARGRTERERSRELYPNLSDEILRLERERRRNLKQLAAPNVTSNVTSFPRSKPRSPRSIANVKFGLVAWLECRRRQHLNKLNLQKKLKEKAAKRAQYTFYIAAIVLAKCIVAVIFTAMLLEYFAQEKKIPPLSYVMVEVCFNTTWYTQFDDVTSKFYNEHKVMFETKGKACLAGLQGLFDVSVTAFRPGSICVAYKVALTDRRDVPEVKMAFDIAVNSGYFVVSKPVLFIETYFECQAGHYINLANVSCESCTIGTFSDNRQATHCSYCPEGYSTSSTGALHVSDCKPLHCELPVIEHATTSASSALYGETVTYTCDKGYEVDNNVTSFDVTCLGYDDVTDIFNCSSIYGVNYTEY